jgi:hypothetical protein
VTSASRLLAGIDGQTRADLLEIIDYRADNKATIITSQFQLDGGVVTL